MFMWTVEFWKATAELAVRGAASAAILSIGAEQINALTTNWVTVGGFAAGGAALSVLWSLGSSPFGKVGAPTILEVK
jgi:hypothetical protein